MCRKLVAALNHSEFRRSVVPSQGSVSSAVPEVTGNIDSD